MTSADRSDASFFETKYRQQPDPWNFAGSEYELGRYRAILGALDGGTGQRYRHALEPGCSVGVLTGMLAAICERVEAMDFSATAVSEAQRRCLGLRNVSLSCERFPAGMDVEHADLLVLSEIGYYFGADEWQTIVNGLIARMRPGTTVLAAHWTGVSEDHQIGGAEVHRILRGCAGLCRVSETVHEGFLLDRWVRP